MLSYQHIMTYWYDPGSTKYEMGVVCYTMLLCCKMQALGHNYADGQVVVYKMQTKPGQKEEYQGLSSYQISKMIKDAPSLLEITSYIFFCQTAALGIFFEFADYKKFIERTHEYKSVPSPIWPTLELFG